MIFVWMASVAFVLAIVIAWLFCRPHANALDIGVLSQQLRSVDVDAFLNLVDCREEAYLREHLPARAFRKIHRERMFAAMQYTWHAAKTARLLMRFAETAKTGSDSGLTGTADSLYADALDLRIRALQMLFHLMLGAALPGRSALPDAFASNYQSMPYRLLTFARQRAAAELPRTA